MSERKPKNKVVMEAKKTEYNKDGKKVAVEEIKRVEYESQKKSSKKHKQVKEAGEGGAAGYNFHNSREIGNLLLPAKKDN